VARVTYSPLIADIRGKTADAVFSSWKGRAYVRMHVIPANPQTAAQTAVRNALAEAVVIWQGMGSQLVTGYGVGADVLNISGYNDMVGRNRTAIQAETGLFAPRRNHEAALPRIAIPTDWAYDSEPGAGQAAYTWTDPGQGADYRIGMLVYNSTDNVVTYQNHNINPLSVGTQTVGHAGIGDTFLCMAYVYRASDGEMVHFGSSAHEQAS